MLGRWAGVSHGKHPHLNSGLPCQTAWTSLILGLGLGPDERRYSPPVTGFSQWKVCPRVCHLQARPDIGTAAGTWGCSLSRNTLSFSGPAQVARAPGALSMSPEPSWTSFGLTEQTLGTSDDRPHWSVAINLLGKRGRESFGRFPAHEQHKQWVGLLLRGQLAYLVTPSLPWGLPSSALPR